MIIDEDEYLEHYGTPRHSGRYPWGSGEAHESGATRNKSFLDTYYELKKSGMADTDVCRTMGIGTTNKNGEFKPSTTQLRARITMERSSKKQDEVANALKLHDKGMGNTAAARQMGVNESYFRTLIAAGAADKAKQLTSIADMLQKEVDEKEFVDVGSGVQNHIGVTKERLDVALAMLKEKGYSIHPVPVPQATTKHDTNTRVLVKPGVTQNDAWRNRNKIQQITLVSTDKGRPDSWGRNDYPPLSVHPDRVAVKWGDEGGAEKDGVLYVRPGVKDISLGKSRYAQVRVKVGDGHYLKGMAMYNDNLPKGTDILFHTNKPKSGNKLDAMKPLTKDPSLPFGSVIRRQIKDNDGTPDEKLTSAMNIVNEEGDWKNWSRNISAQALSKQNPRLAKEQLGKILKSRQDEYDEIMSLTNPTVREKLLGNFSDETDKAAVHLKAAALDRQNWHAILPIESMKPTEIYAPKYNNGERVALIRYPHGGTFEIPELTVNNRHPEARSLIEGAEDAVGIHHSVAERLSGADFDGDTVLVIPNDKDHIKSTPALEELKNFDPKRLYKLPEGQTYSKEVAGAKALKINTQMLMGLASNLITDMTLQGAPHRDIANAVKHSMVVIDAEKHDLDWKRSYRDHNIKALSEKYQAKADPTKRAGGAATLISRAKGREVILDRKPRPYKEGGPINKETGELEWVPSGKTRSGPNGTRIPIRANSTRLGEAKDAHDLVSTAKTPMERIYADHSNALKALANKARLSQINTPTLKINSSAKKQYASEVESLDAALALAKRNSPLERQANIIARVAINQRMAANPDLKGDTLNRIKQQEMQKARDRVGAKKDQIIISDKEWHAIQAGAISNSKLSAILDNADLERVRELATPRPERLMTRGKTSQAQGLLDAGYTKAEVARRLGVSVSTLDLAVSADSVDEEDT